ncbi:MAG: 30S ribosomal protein S5 [Candidatus Woesearchaeota archaeon]
MVKNKEESIEQEKINDENLEKIDLDTSQEENQGQKSKKTNLAEIKDDNQEEINEKRENKGENKEEKENEVDDDTIEDIDEIVKVVSEEDKTESEDDDVKEVEEIENVKKIKAKEVSDAWTPKTQMGLKVKLGEIVDIDSILDSGIKLLEPEITDMLLPNMDIELLAIGQSKGKFGGGQRRVFRQTQKKTKEGNKPQFSTFAVCGNYDGYFGFGYGKAKETVPAREKAFRQCKLNLIKIRRACSSWECNCGMPHTIPYKVDGKCGSVKIVLIPAPKGTGICAEKEIAKILKLAGIKDIWSKTIGYKSSTKLNHIYACIDALSKLTKMKVNEIDKKRLNIVEGKIKKTVEI